MSTQKTATGCELTLNLRDDSGHRAPWHETSEIRAMAQLSLQYPDCLVESISSHCLRLIGTRSPEIDRMAFLRGVVLMGLRPGSPTGDPVVSNRVFYLATQETVMIALGWRDTRRHSFTLDRLYGSRRPVQKIHS